jgi:transcriptional regulator with XRE-family HTH domain
MTRTTRTTISRILRLAIRSANYRQHQIARLCGVHPVTLSCWMSGARDVELGDPRVIAIGNLLNVPDGECFELTATQQIGVR